METSHRTCGGHVQPPAPEGRGDGGGRGLGDLPSAGGTRCTPYGPASQCCRARHEHWAYWGAHRRGRIRTGVRACRSCPLRRQSAKKLPRNLLRAACFVMEETGRGAARSRMHAADPMTPARRRINPPRRQALLGALE